MRLSTRGRYAVWLMLALARRGGDGHTSLREISKNTNISRRYLEQLACALRRASLLRGQTGRSGGYELTRSPETMTIAEILEAAAGPVNVVDCVRDPAICLRAEICECRWLYATINERIRGVLGQLTLGDLMDEPHPEKLGAVLAGNPLGCPVTRRSKPPAFQEQDA